jgi:beta-phosphoglucomutase-like phosphatase (HAD superfamily)
MKEEPSTPDDAFFKRVTNLVLIELAKKFPDQADRAAALLGLVVDEIAAIEDREDRVQICKAAYRVFYLGALGHDPVEALEC